MEQKSIVPSVFADNKGMTSIEISEVTGKEHKNVLRDIRNILNQDDVIARYSIH